MPNAEPMGSQLGDITDLQLPDADPCSGAIYPGPKPIPGNLCHLVERLRDQARHLSEVSLDFKITVDGVGFRGHRQETVEGVEHIFRKMCTSIKSLRDIGVHEGIRNIILSSSLNRGGLILVAGETGHGKTTTCVSAVIDRLKLFGGFCMTVEDPPEMPMQGWHHGENGVVGKCLQAPVGAGGFAAGLRDALRCYPTGITSSILMVGEVRDSETAAQLLRASLSGHLVFATMHGADVLAALERLLALARESVGQDESRSLLAHSLRLAIYQRIENGRLVVQPLYSKDATSPTANRIKAGNIQMISTELSYQKNLLADGRLGYE